MITGTGSPVPMKMMTGMQALADCRDNFGRETKPAGPWPPFGDAARGHHHAERGDERRNRGVGDQRAIDQPGEQPAAERHQHRHENRQVGQALCQEHRLGIGVAVDCRHLRESSWRSSRWRRQSNPRTGRCRREMITCVTPMAMMPTIDTCRMMICRRAALKKARRHRCAVEQETVAEKDAADQFEDDDENDERQEDVEFRPAMCVSSRHS